MENTNTNYTTNKTLMDYLNANIDVHINYLLFLNSFKSLSQDKGFMEIAPIIESIREKLYQAFDYDLIPDDTRKVNYLITKKLGEYLDKANLSEIKKYIGTDITEEDIINLSTVIFLRKSIANNYLIDEVNKPETKIISSTLNKMVNRIPSTDITINGYSFELASYFLESLKIKAEKNQSIVSYIYDFISDTSLINSMIKRLDSILSTSIESDFLKRELFASLCLISNYSLANLVDELNNNLKIISQKENKDLTLEKTYVIC